MLAVESFFFDLRLAFRFLAKNPLLKVVLIATLTLGVGANTAIFTVLSAVLFPNLPYSDAGELIILQTITKTGRTSEVTSYPRFQDWTHEAHSFEGLAGESQQVLVLSTQGETEPLAAEFVTADYFSVLRVNPELGRSFTREETVPARTSPIALISKGLWQRRFGGEPDIIGKVLRLNGQPFTVVGVLPQGMRGISQKAEVWIPINMIGVVSTSQLLENRFATWVSVIGRLAPGTPVKVAQEEMNVVSARLAAEWHEKDIKPVQVTPLQSRSLKRYSRQVFILFGAVAFVLLIACLNVANLLLSYFSDRKSELAVRNALGASRLRLFQQLLLESLVLSGLGGVLGLLAAMAAVRWLGSGVISVMAGIGPLEVNTRVLLFTAGISLATGLISGLLPLLQVISTGLGENLKSHARTGTSFGRARLRTMLVVGQISLAVVLVVGAGLMMRTMMNLANVDLGFQSDSVLIAKLSPLPTEKYDTQPKVVAFYDALLDHLAGFPQIRSVGIASSVPLQGSSPSVPFLIRGRSDLSANHPPTVQYIVASDGYFSAMSIPVLRGRVLEKTDTSNSAPVALINEAMARAFWPGQNPIGQFLNIFDTGPPREIVGIVGDVRASAVNTAGVPEVYLPYRQVPPDFISMLRSFPPAITAKTAGSPEGLSSSIRSIVTGLESNEAVLDVATMTSVVSKSVAEPRLYSELLLMFAVLALGLAAIGIYGVVSYSVTQRTQELGVRMALGASRGSVLRLILGQGMLFAVLGISLGLAGAWALSRVLNTLLFEIKSSDPLTFLLAVLALWLVSMAAALLPAWRASRVDPSTALREQ